jgi:hypothetical protein
MIQRPLDELFQEGGIDRFLIHGQASLGVRKTVLHTMHRFSPEYSTDSRVFSGSISRWVPTRENPEGSDEKGVGVVGEVQRGYSGPSDRRLADDP